MLIARAPCAASHIENKDNYEPELAKMAYRIRPSIRVIDYGAYNHPSVTDRFVILFPDKADCIVSAKRRLQSLSVLISRRNANPLSSRVSFLHISAALD